MDEQLFANPPNEYRPAPFWSVNDVLEPEKLRRHVREFARVGYGGWFFHPRVGLSTKYLSPAWMDCFEAALEEGKKHGHLCWIYDEDSYPSGFAGGLVLQEYPQYRGKTLKIVEDEAPADRRILARFAVRTSGSSLIKSRRLDPDQQPESDEEELFFIEEPDLIDGWHNNNAYVDMLNPAAIDAFITITHERYAERFREDFGKAIPGVFTDEPHIAPRGGHWAWTDDLEVDFQKEHDYSLFDHLPELFFRGEKSGRVRTDYWRTVARRFQKVCLQRMADWCEEHGLVLTGHCWEHEFPRCGYAGSFNYAEIPMQWPGIDVLGVNAPKARLRGKIQSQTGRITVVKSISGLAHQFDRKRIMSETYGGGGWEMTFRDLKEVLDWQCVLGVNYIVPHLSHYSLRGCRKRDFPPVFLDYAPWWPELRLINDYTGRLCYALSTGAPKVDIAVLQPLSTAWDTCGSWPEEVATLDRIGMLYEGLLHELAAAQWEFDLVDEMTLAEHGGVKDKRLVVGKAEYSVMVVPPMHTLYSAALDVLEKFCKAGGQILWVPPVPQLVDGGDCGKLGELLASENSQTVPLDGASLEEPLKALVLRSLVAQPMGSEVPLPVYVQTRELSDCETVFWMNISEESAMVKFRYAGAAAVEEWDLLSGDVKGIPADVEEGQTTWWAHVVPGQSQLLRFRQGGKPSKPALSPAGQKPCAAVDLTAKWQHQLGNPNVLVMDMASYRVADESWSEPKQIWMVLKELRERFGMANERELRGNRGARFYDIWADPKRFETIQLRQHVSCTVDPDTLGPLHLVVESGERFTVTVNGQSGASPDGTWISDCFTTFPVGGLLRRGENEIVLTTDFVEDSELETVFLTGDFGVWRHGATAFELGSLPEVLGPGSWVEQGLPFFSGRLRISQDVKLPDGDGQWRLMASNLILPLATVYVNGQKAGDLLWPPYCVDLPCNGGETVRLELECITGMRNTLGPWHWDVAWDEYPITGPTSWLNQCGGWNNEYHLYPDGIPEGLRLERIGAE